VSGASDIAKGLIGLGLIIAVVGLVLLGVSRLAGRQGWPPGDIVIHKPGFSLHFPIVTSLIVSVLLSLVFLLIGWLRR
jgi:hypothetical protein